MKNTSIASLTNKEQRQHSSSFIPYSIYDCLIPESFPNVPMHWHDEFEIDYVLHGEGDFICNDEHFHADAGDVILISPQHASCCLPISQRVAALRRLCLSCQYAGPGQQ